MKQRHVLIVGVLSLGLSLALLVGLAAWWGTLTKAQGDRVAAQGAVTPQDALAPEAPLGTAFTYQGRLEDNGSPVSGTCDFRFALHDAASDGAQIGSTETRTDVELTDGRFAVNLDFGASAFTGEARWLEIAVQCSGDAAYTTLGRQALKAAPYALYAMDADRLDGQNGSAYANASHDHLGQTWTGTDNPLKIDGSFGVYPDNAALVLSNSHNEGDGLLVDSPGDDGVQVTSAGGDGVYVQWAGDYGVFVQSAGKDGVNVYYADGDGFTVCRTGSTTRCTPDTDNHGLEVGNAQHDGVHVSNAGEDGVHVEHASVHALRVISATQDGLHIWETGRDGLRVWDAGGYGVYVNQAVQEAGYFNGDVYVSGTINKGAVGFKIDHPLAPESRYLYHSGVESPDMMNVYNGNVSVDADGEAWVELPDWFEALNRDYRYQLTPIGAPGPNLYVAEEIGNNRFKIAGGTPGLKVSWQVTGIRHDAYADTHRIPVEEDKPAEERGTYLHPQAYGQPETMGLAYKQAQENRAPVPER